MRAAGAVRLGKVKGARASARSAASARRARAGDPFSSGAAARQANNARSTGSSFFGLPMDGRWYSVQRQRSSKAPDSSSRNARLFLPPRSDPNIRPERVIKDLLIIKGRQSSGTPPETRLSNGILFGHHDRRKKARAGVAHFYKTFYS